MASATRRHDRIGAVARHHLVLAEQAEAAGQFERLAHGLESLDGVLQQPPRVAAPAGHAVDAAEPALPAGERSFVGRRRQMLEQLLARGDRLVEPFDALAREGPAFEQPQARRCIRVIGMRERCRTTSRPR